MAEPLPDADVLAALEARLERAAQATERLLADAAAAAAEPVADAGPEPSVAAEPVADADADAEPSFDARDPARESAGTPPRGWQRRESSERSGSADPGDAELLLSILALVRDRVPAELQRRLAAALHELLLAVRALLDWCAERIQRRHDAPPQVQDIPIL